MVLDRFYTLGPLCQGPDLLQVCCGNHCFEKRNRVRGERAKFHNCFAIVPFQSHDSLYFLSDQRYCAYNYKFNPVPHLATLAWVPILGEQALAMLFQCLVRNH